MPPTRTLEKIAAVLLVAVLGVALAVEVRAVPSIPLVIVLVITVCGGMDLVLRGEARYRPTPDLFILPTALILGAVLFLPLLSSGTAVVIGLAVFGALLFAVFWAEHGIRVGLVDVRQGERALAAIGYAAAFVLFASIYQAKARSILSSTAAVAATFVLATRQLRLAHQFAVAETGPVAPVAEPDAGGAQLEESTLRAPAGTASTAPAQSSESAARVWPRTVVYAAAVSLAVGEVMWALNYWPLSGLTGGAFLVAGFYFLTSVCSHQLYGRLSTRLVAEYGVVAAAGALIISIAGLARRVI
jgi:hypothetical protein